MPNLATHGVTFDLAEGFEWSRALVWADTRLDHRVPRLSALGAIGDCLCLMVCTVEARSTRIISLREANRRKSDLVERLRASGPGWQARINAVLRKSVME